MGDLQNQEVIIESENNQDNKELIVKIEDESIKNMLSQYKSQEELAKAKINTDKEYSKLKSEKLAYEEITSQKIFNSEKRNVMKDKSYLLDVILEDTNMAEKISKEVFWKTLDEVLDEIEIDELWKQDWQNDQLLTKEKLDELVEFKANKLLAEKQLKLNKNNDYKKIESSLNDFIKDKWFETWSEEEKTFISIYEDLIEWKDKTLTNVEKMLKISFNSFIQDNSEYNKNLKDKKDNLKNSPWLLTIKGNNGNDITYTEEDLNIAKRVGMKIEKYIEMKKYQRF